MRLLYSDTKTGLTASMELDEDKGAMLLNRKIGDEIEGSTFGMTGYKLRITGGSDTSGFPLDRSIAQQGKIRVMRVQYRKKREPARRMMTVRGNLIGQDTRQVSAIITEYGSKPVGELFPKREANANEEKKDEGK